MKVCFETKANIGILLGFSAAAIEGQWPWTSPYPLIVVALYCVYLMHIVYRDKLQDRNGG